MQQKLRIFPDRSYIPFFFSTIVFPKAPYTFNSLKSCEFEHFCSLSSLQCLRKVSHSICFQALKEPKHENLEFVITHLASGPSNPVACLQERSVLDSSKESLLSIMYLVNWKMLFFQVKDPASFGQQPSQPYGRENNLVSCKIRNHGPCVPSDGFLWDVRYYIVAFQFIAF